MKTIHLKYALAVLCLMTVSSSQTLAQDAHDHMPPSQEQATETDQQSNANTLVNVVRQATERFKDVTVAEAEGYALQFGCVAGDDFGAMGLHYVNSDLVNKGVLDATRPQIVIYEPTPDGGKKLIGADFLVLVDTWNATHTSPPEMMGQNFHLFTSPNRFGLPPFYTLHVWAWKSNPKGAFVNWHPNVSCQHFSAQ